MGSSPESFQMKIEMHAQHSHIQNTTCQTKILQHVNTLLIRLLHMERRAMTKLSNISTVKLKAGRELQLLSGILGLREEHTKPVIEEFQTLT